MSFNSILFACCNKSSAVEIEIPVTDTSHKNKPALNGRLVFHQYSCYNCNDSRIVLYNFKTNQLQILSEDWDIINPMNAHFSPQGDRIVFMGINSSTGNWDVFIKSLNNNTPPVNLTISSNKTRNEDPKFSSNGNEIIFKSDGVLTSMDTLGNRISIFSNIETEASMPYYIKKDSIILFAAEKNGISGIYALNHGKTLQTLFNVNGVYAYYPIAFNDNSFVFTRWHSASNHHDQLYMGYLDGSPAQRLPFNDPEADYSDAYTADGVCLFVSSTRKGGKGGYDLYIADKNTGQMWSMSEYENSINSILNELGATYHR